MAMLNIKSLLFSLTVIGISLIPTVSLAQVPNGAFNFERKEGWWFAGNSGLDYGKNLAHRGRGNGWVRNHTGWNAINNKVSVPPNTSCSLSAWLRMSDTLTAGYMSVRSWNNDGSPGPILNEIKLVGPNRQNPSHRNYNYYEFNFNSGSNREILLYIGLHGNGKDAWIQADDIEVNCAN